MRRELEAVVINYRNSHAPPIVHPTAKLGDKKTALLPDIPIPKPNTSVGDTCLSAYFVLASILAFLHTSSVMKLDSRGIVSVVEIVVYIPLLLLSVKLLAKYGFKREGWLYLLILSISMRGHLFPTIYPFTI